LPAHAAPADELRALVDANKGEAAYQYGSAHPEELGQPAFDFYFGIAAIDSGHAGEGVLALERYILQFPDNANARAQLARGYFVLGDDARARQEFEDLLRTKPPEPVVAVIERYLNALKGREGSYKTTSSAYVETGLGYDTNANSGASGPNVNVPVFGLVTLLPAGVHVATFFNSMSAGGQITQPLAPGFAVFGGVAIDSKQNFRNTAQAYNLLTYGGNGGLTYLKDSNLFRLTGSLSEVELNGLRFIDSSALTAEWTRQLDELQTLTPSLQYADLRYPTQPVRDSAITSLGLAYRRAFAHPWQPVLSVSGAYGEERNTRAVNLGRRISSVRVAGGVAPWPKWVLSAGVTYQESQYRGPEPFLLTTRHDRYGGVDVQLAYQLTRNLSIRGELNVVANHSNVGLYAYDRDVMAVKLRYEFK
jgi:hypothetical protein